MCGRFTNSLPWPGLHELMGLIGALPNLRPRCNAAPGHDITVVRAAAAGRSPAEDGGPDNDSWHCGDWSR